MKSLAILLLVGLVLTLGCSKDDNPTAANGHRAGDERDFRLGNTDQTIRMCWIPAGNFQMGSQDGEQDRRDNEGPVHQVTFAEGFWMGKYEVTQKQWRAVMKSNPSYFHGESLPVEQVSWQDIWQFEDSFRRGVSSAE